MAAAKVREGRVRNVVHDDAIWRQTVHYELITAQNWEPQWGFMKEAMINKQRQVQDARQAKKGANGTAAPHSTTTTSNTTHGFSKLPPINTNASGLPSKLPSGLVEEEDSIVTDWLVSYRVPQIIRYRQPQEKYHVPCTTNSEVGWVWAQNGSNGDKPAKFHTLERFPREAHGKHNILKWWGGTRESMP